MDTFLDDTHKKSVSDWIRRCNKEKKLSKAEQASLNQDQEFDTECSTSEKILEVSNPVTKILAGAPAKIAIRRKSDKATSCDVISIESLNQNSSTDSLISLAQLFDKADDAEYGAIRANQEEVLRWYYYRKEFLTQHNDNDNTNVEEVSELITPIPITHGSNSLGNSSFTPQIAPAESEKGTNEVQIVDD
ncbi:26076_t:CDS:2, partial [Dentiscutata erythropus]